MFVGFSTLALFAVSMAQETTIEEKILLRAQDWRACVVESSAQAGLKSKQAAEDVVLAFIDECHFPEVHALLVMSSKAHGSSDEIAQMVADQMLRGERLSVASEARTAVVKARVRAGQ